MRINSFQFNNPFNTFKPAIRPIMSYPVDVVSFSGKTPKIPDDFYKPDIYESLTEQQKDILRGRVSTELGNTIFDNDQLLEDLVIIASMVDRANKNNRIVSLGRSPLWILEGLKHMSGKEYKYVPGSRFDKVVPKSNTEYKEILKNYEMDPASIIEHHRKTNQKTVVLDFVNSGGSLNFVMTILEELANIQSIDIEKLKEALEFNIILAVDGGRYEFQPEDVNDLAFDTRVLTSTPNYKDLIRKLVWQSDNLLLEKLFEPQDWHQGPPEPGPPDDVDEEKIRLAQFALLDYIKTRH